MQAARACCALLQGGQADVARHYADLQSAAETALPWVSCGPCPCPAALPVGGLMHCPVAFTVPFPRHAWHLPADCLTSGFIRG